MRLSFVTLELGIVLAGAGVAWAGPVPGHDSDGDGVSSAFDNCTSVANVKQADSDHNGCGDACTEPISCDANGDAVGADGLIIGMNFGMVVPPGTAGDCNGDTVVGGPDLLTFGWSS